MEYRRKGEQRDSLVVHVYVCIYACVTLGLILILDNRTFFFLFREIYAYIYLAPPFLFRTQVRGILIRAIKEQMRSLSRDFF